MDDVDQLLAERAIRRRLLEYCRGIDRLDTELVVGVYHPDGTDDHGTFVGLGRDFARYAVERLATHALATSHIVGDSLFDFVDDDTVDVETPVLAFHRCRSDDGREHLERFGGRYLDRFERRDGDWRISARRLTWDWDAREAIEPAFPPGRFTPSPRRGRPGKPSSVEEVDLFDAATQEDWNPTHDLLREEAPVWRMPGTDVYVLTRYDDANHVLRRTETFVRGAGAQTPGRGMSSRTAAIYAAGGWPRLTPLALDPPVHRRYRELVDPFFSVRGAERQRSMITGIVHELVDAIAGRGEMEYVADIAVPLPVRVITMMMGFRADDIPQLKEWSEAWVLPFRGRLTEAEEVYAGEKGVEFQHHIHATIEAKRARPDDSVISFLANDARFDGERPLTDAEIIGMADHLYIGGNETTTFALTSGLWLLLTHPDAHAALLADRRRIRHFVEEVLRLESPTMGMVRRTAHDTEIAGVPIPAGSSIHLRYAAANRDRRVFDRPAELDLERPNAARHLAFSNGETHCPGAGLSRLEQHLALEVLLDRLPNLRLTPGANDFAHHPNVTLRAMKELHVSFDPVT